MPLGPVVQRLDNAIHRINHYPVDSVVCFVNTYPLDSDLSGGQRYPAFEQPGPDRSDRCFAQLSSLLTVLDPGVILITNLAYLLHCSNVFNEVEVNSYQIWKYQYYYLVMEYNKQPPLAPPFAIIYHLVEVVRWLGKKCRKPNKVTRKQPRTDLHLMLRVICSLNSCIVWVS